MNILQPWQLLLVALAGWINRQQQDVIEYLQEENRVLRSKLKGKRIRFTDDGRRRLAVKANGHETAKLRSATRGALRDDDVVHVPFVEQRVIERHLANAHTLKRAA